MLQNMCSWNLAKIKIIAICDGSSGSFGGWLGRTTAISGSCMRSVAASRRATASPRDSKLISSGNRDVLHHPPILVSIPTQPPPSVSYRYHGDEQKARTVSRTSGPFRKATVLSLGHAERAREAFAG